MIGFDQDCVQRFVFERARVRGEIVRLDASWRELLRRHEYPPAVRNALGELMAACALLAATVKIQGGGLVLQIQGGEPVGLLVVECQADLTLRGTAMYHKGVEELGEQATLRALTRGSRCVLTIDPGEGKQLYQSVVPLEGVSTAEVLQRYMERSEQIDTRFVLAADENRATGLMIQKMPALGGTAPVADDPALWDRVGGRLDGITRADLLARPLNELMHQLIDADELQLFESMKARFRCRCSRERVAGVVRMIGAEEARSVIAEQGKISIRCEFCGEAWSFDAAETEAALAAPDEGTPEPADA